MLCLTGIRQIIEGQNIRMTAVAMWWLAGGYEVDDLSIQWFEGGPIVERKGNRAIIHDNWQIAPSVNEDNFTRLITTA
ncbi:MAG: hypothetical protein WC891_08920 [Actinomycetota bacterium]